MIETIKFREAPVRIEIACLVSVVAVAVTVTAMSIYNLIGATRGCYIFLKTKLAEK